MHYSMSSASLLFAGLLGLLCMLGCDFGKEEPADLPPDGGTAPAASADEPEEGESRSMETVGMSELPQLSVGRVMTPPANDQAVYHTVKPGETLSKIGQKYGKTADQLLESNGLDRGAFLQPGQLIYIPK